MSELLKDEVFLRSNNSTKIKRYLESIKMPIHDSRFSKNIKASHVILALFQILSSFLKIDASNAIVDLMSEVYGAIFSVDFEEAKDTLFRYLDEEHSAVIVIDTLDQYEGLRDIEMQQALGSMLQAVTKFSMGGVHKNIHVKCFLPAEIVPYLIDTTIQNIGKTFEKPMYLHWRPRDLLKIVCWRYHFFLKNRYPNHVREIGHIEWDDYDDVRKKIWDKYFPHTLRNSSGIIEEDSFQYIIRHTQLRPRQIIWICNQIADESCNTKVFPNFYREQIVQGTYNIEDKLAEEVINAYREIYPRNRHILNCFIGEQNIIPKSTYLDKLAPRTRRHWTESLPYDRLLFTQMVTELGIIGAIEDESGKYYVTEFEYTKSDRLVLSPDDSCAIHPMFYKLLRIKTDKNKAVLPKGPFIN